MTCVADRSPGNDDGSGGARKRILVIKLGALGDLVLAFAPFAAIRRHHPDDHLTLLTTPPFVGLATACPWFDAVVVDERPRFWNRSGQQRLRAALSGFDFVYDLQTSGRSSRFRRLAGRPPWSGIARGASHPDADPDRDRLHTRLRQAGQLAQAGIAEVPDADLSWLAASGATSGVASGATPGAMSSAPAALLVPGAAPHRPAKRWPADRFAAVAVHLAASGFRPVVLGGRGDRELGALIRAACPATLDLTGQTSLVELGAVCAGAVLAVGNDTGPMHMAAAMGCACLVLFSADSDPALTAPVGRVEVLRTADLSVLPVNKVIERLDALVASLVASLPTPDKRPGAAGAG